MLYVAKYVEDHFAREDDRIEIIRKVDNPTYDFVYALMAGVYVVDFPDTLNTGDKVDRYGFCAVTCLYPESPDSGIANALYETWNDGVVDLGMQDILVAIMHDEQVAVYDIAHSRICDVEFDSYALDDMCRNDLGYYFAQREDGMLRIYTEATDYVHGNLTEILWELSQRSRGLLLVATEFVEKNYYHMSVMSEAPARQLFKRVYARDYGYNPDIDFVLAGR